MFMKHCAPNRCEPSIEVIMKMGVGFWGCQGGWERGVEVIVKNLKKKIGGGGGAGLKIRKTEGGVKVDVTKKRSFVVIQKMSGGGWVGERVGFGESGVGLGGEGSGWM